MDGTPSFAGRTDSARPVSAEAEGVADVGAAIDKVGFLTEELG